MYSQIKQKLINVCYECILITLLLISWGFKVKAQSELTVADDFQMAVNNGLWVAVALSAFGGVVGLLGRLQDQAWLTKAKTTSLIGAILGEIAFSIFIGVLILFLGTENGMSSYQIISAVLVGSWLGTKAGRLLLAYVKSSHDRISDSLGGK